MAAKKTRTRKRRKTTATQLAAIDVGSTSVRMQVAELSGNGVLAMLDELVHPVALGVDTFGCGYITRDTLRAVCRVLANFSRVLDDYDVRDFRAVATSAIRDAGNRDIVVDRIAHETGFRLHVLDAVEESRLTYQVMLPFLEKNVGDTEGYTLFLDLGGGSTETMVLQGRNLVLTNTRRLGTARLLHNCAGAGAGNEQMLLESVIRNVVHSTLSVYRDYTMAHCVVTNSQLLKAFDGRGDVGYLDGGLNVHGEMIMRAAKEVQGLAPEQVAERFGVSISDVELLVPALLILDRFLREIRVERVYMAEMDLLSGIFHDLILLRQGENPALVFSEQVIRSARGLAEKYGYDADHSLHVAELAVELYDGVAGFLDLGGKDRLYLEVAAILHDIGMFVSERAHHKHSMYLIEWSEVVGLDADERSLVALIARYHRKNHPRPQHAEFMRLPMEDRLRVTKLAAVLRLADALDRGHRQIIETVAAQVTETDLVLRAKSRHDLVVETMALKEKATLFEEATGLQVKLLRGQLAYM